MNSIQAQKGIFGFGINILKKIVLLPQNYASAKGN